MNTLKVQQLAYQSSSGAAQCATASTRQLIEEAQCRLQQGDAHAALKVRSKVCRRPCSARHYCARSPASPCHEFRRSALNRIEASGLQHAGYHYRPSAPRRLSGCNACNHVVSWRISCTLAYINMILAPAQLPCCDAAATIETTTECGNCHRVREALEQGPEPAAVQQLEAMLCACSLQPDAAALTAPDAPGNQPAPPPQPPLQTWQRQAAQQPHQQQMLSQPGTNVDALAASLRDSSLQPQPPELVGGAGQCVTSLVHLSTMFRTAILKVSSIAREIV